MATSDTHPTAVPRMARPEIHAAAPGLGWYTDHVLYHEVWNRPGLSPRDRSLVTIAALLAGGRMPQLKSHLGRGLANGLEPSEIVEVITHLAFFAGWPNAMSAVPVMTGVFADRGIDTKGIQAHDPDARVSAGRPPRPAELLPHGGGPFSAAMRECTSRPVVDELWDRAGLSKRDRSLATVAAVLALGDLDDLPLYVARSTEHGVPVAELAEAVAHLAFYVGWSHACAAATLLDAGK